MTIGRRATLAVLGTLGGLIAIVVPDLGADPWPFSPPSMRPHGVLGSVVRAAGRHWDHGFIRTPATVVALVVAAAALVALHRPLRKSILVALAAVVVLSLLLPAVVLQVGLREATAPWYHVNDSTYQIELAGDAIRHGDDPYGYDYTRTGLKQWYPAAGFPPQRKQAALHHLAYFPGTPLTATAWRILPRPLDDYRFFVVLCTFGTFLAALAFRAPLALRIALGAVAAANPLAVRAAWFGTADAPALLCVILAFAFVSRRRFMSAAVALAVAVLLKQFALVAIPFVAVATLMLRPARKTITNAVAAFVAVIVTGFLPFLIADAGALWRDTVSYGGSTYRIIGYGLSSLWLKAGFVDDRYGAYPFGWFLLLVWLPVTAWLVWHHWRTRRVWVTGVGFAVSMFVLLFIARVFQTSYFVWPLIAIVVAALLAHSDDEDVGARTDVSGEVDRGELQPITTRP